MALFTYIFPPKIGFQPPPPLPVFTQNHRGNPIFSLWRGSSVIGTLARAKLAACLHTRAHTHTQEEAREKISGERADYDVRRRRKGSPFPINFHRSEGKRAFFSPRGGERSFFWRGKTESALCAEVSLTCNGRIVLYRGKFITPYIYGSLSPHLHQSQQVPAGACVRGLFPSSPPIFGTCFWDEVRPRGESVSSPLCASFLPGGLASLLSSNISSPIQFLR